jgi:hypothetical protein
VLLQVAAIVVAVGLSKYFQVASASVTAVALAPTIPGAWLAWRAYRDDRSEAALDVQPKADALAGAVLADETEHRAQLIGEGGHRIDVAFRYRRELANNAAGAAEQGHMRDVVTYYRALQPARLVITGEPGSGKTLLAVELLLGLLTSPDRAQNAPVPIRASLADWDTARPLQEWLTERVYDQLRETLITMDDARRLVAQRRVLPLLDGLDEMDSDSTPVSARRAPKALAQLNSYQDVSGSAPVILTCRTTQYNELAALDIRMREAARVEITPLTGAQVTAYLTERSTNPTRWQSVIDALTRAPHGTLATALNTPWRLNLAVTIYEERDRATFTYRRDPADLLAIPSPTELQAHLLSDYLPAAVRQHPARPGHYSPAQVHRWLAALAAHLATTSADTGMAATAAGGARTDLVLHRLWPMAGIRRVRTVDAFLCLTFCLAVNALYLPYVNASISGVPLFINTLTVIALSLGPFVRARRRNMPLMRLRRRSDRRNHLRQALLGSSAGMGWIKIALLLGSLFGLILGIVIGVQDDSLPVMLVAGPLMGALGFILLGILLGLLEALFAGPAATGSSEVTVAPVSPRSPLTDDLLAGLVMGQIFGIVLGLLFGSFQEAGPAHGLALGVATACFVTLAWGLGAEWRRYAVFLICTRGQMPWRLDTFLRWSYSAGLLRISGIAYQFRHRELQEWIVVNPGP